MTDEQENEGNPEGDAGQICPGPEGPGRGPQRGRGQADGRV